MTRFYGFQLLNTESFCKHMARNQRISVEFHAISVVYYIELLIVLFEFCWFNRNIFLYEKKNLKFSRTLFTIFTYVIQEKFSRTDCQFHVQFLRNFHGRFSIFTERLAEISKNFHGRVFFFHAGKKNTGKNHPATQKTEIFHEKMIKK